MLFDTSILIPYFRGLAYRDLFEGHLQRRRAWLSAVTVMELYAGTASVREMLRSSVTATGIEQPEDEALIGA